eukprot:g54965.t1
MLATLYFPQCWQHCTFRNVGNIVFFAIYEKQKGGPNQKPPIDANIGLREMTKRLVPTRDPSKAQPSLVWIRAFESDLRRRPARRPGPTGSSATSGTWRRELADLARSPAVRSAAGTSVKRTRVPRASTCTGL